VLVVEDEASIASFVSLYLKNAGYEVRTASNGADALASVQSHQPSLISTASRSAGASARNPMCRS
jgi:DNA-binding response OmpR family regulator